MKKASLSPMDVRHIATLAKISLTGDEVKKFQKQLSSILSFVTTLNRIPITNVPETNQVTGLENVFRDDEILPSLSQSDALSNAPRAHNGYFLVKPVQEGEGE